MKTEHTLSPSKVMVLQELCRKGVRIMYTSELRDAASLGLKPNAFFTMLRRMGDAGLLVNIRERGGMSTASVTREGRKAYKAWLKWAQDRLAEAGLSE